jgi:hypothetical protein
MTGSGWDDRMSRLNDLMAELYPDQDAARQVVRRANLPPDRIRFNPAAGTNWFNILEEAQRRGRVEAIVAIARREFPDRPEWATLTGLGAAPPVVPASTSALPTEADRALDHTAKRDLHRALLAAFPNEAELRRMLGLGMGVNLETIARGNLADIVFQVVQWAEATGRVDELLSAASDMNPGNPELAAFLRRRRG